MIHKILPVVLLTAVFFVACEPVGKKPVQDEVVSDGAGAHPIKVAEPVADVISATDWTAFETVYSHTQDGSVQKLGVKYLSDNEITFRLSEKNNLCDVEYEGTARNRYPDGDGESDDDEEGNAYFAIEYIFEDDGTAIYIRIAEEKDKARIKFVDKTKEETDCVPSPNFLLKQ